jgi:hypothetical protein
VDEIFKPNFLASKSCTNKNSSIAISSCSKSIFFSF